LYELKLLIKSFYFDGIASC